MCVFFLFFFSWQFSLSGTKYSAGIALPKLHSEYIHADNRYANASVCAIRIFCVFMQLRQSWSGQHTESDYRTEWNRRVKLKEKEKQPQNRTASPDITVSIYIFHIDWREAIDFGATAHDKLCMCCNGRVSYHSIYRMRERGRDVFCKRSTENRYERRAFSSKQNNSTFFSIYFFLSIFCLLFVPMHRLLDEVESLEAILMDDVKITKNVDTYVGHTTHSMRILFCSKY